MVVLYQVDEEEIYDDDDPVNDEESETVPINVPLLEHMMRKSMSMWRTHTGPSKREKFEQIEVPTGNSEVQQLPSFTEFHKKPRRETYPQPIQQLYHHGDFEDVDDIVEVEDRSTTPSSSKSGEYFY